MSNAKSIGNDTMTTVYFSDSEKTTEITYMFYTKKEILKLAKKYGLEKDWKQIYIPDYQLFLTRHGKRWYQ